MKKRVVAIVQARTGSTRLPGKVLKKVLGHTLLEYQIDRLKQSRQLDAIIIATTLNKNDDAIIELARHLNLPTFRGKEEDVLDRYFNSAIDSKADCIVRITSDCPLIDPEIIDKTISMFLKDDRYDYVSNTLEKSFPRGMDVEVFSEKALAEAHLFAKGPNEREHVTLYIYKNPQKYRLGNFKNPLGDSSNIRLTVDTQEDFELIKNIIEELYPKNPRFRLVDILKVLKSHPDWLLINQRVQQKDSLTETI